MGLEVGDLPETDEEVEDIGEVGENKLDAATARSILQEAGGDRDKARQIAISRGYKL